MRIKLQAFVFRWSCFERVKRLVSQSLIGSEGVQFCL